MDDKARRIFASGGLTAATLFSLLGGLALVVRALRNVDLTLFLELKRDDKAEKKY